MNDMVQAFVLGIVEGLTEFLPVSSTGHLLIAEHWLGKRSELFNVAIQAGAILAAVLVFWPRISQLLLGLKARDNRDYLAKLLFAFVISGTGGFAAKQLGVMLPETVAPVAGALLIGGLLILLIECPGLRPPPLSAACEPAASSGRAAQRIPPPLPASSRSPAPTF